jgi:hypothetical protein
MGIGTLRKRTFAHPWAIVHISPLNSAVDTEEANVRPALGDRSLPRQAPRTNVRPPATHTHWHAGERSPSTGRSFVLGVSSLT